MRMIYIILAIAIIIAIILSIVIVHLMRNKTKNKLLNKVNELEIKKNNLDSLPVMVELSKIEDIAKSEQLEEKINEFKVRYQEIREVKLKKINDIIVELDVTLEKRNIKEYINYYSDAEIILDEAEYSLNNILDEIDEIASYEEKYRDIITKLKAKYRFLEHSYTERETMFKDLKDVIKMQFENIAKRFNDFDKVMDEKLYNEIILVVKSIDTMIDNLDVVIREVPDILLLLDDLIPGRIKDLKEEYNKMDEEGYPLKYLNFENNISDIEKKGKDILTRAKVLNITDSLFDLRTILEYLDSLFKDLENERNAKTTFDGLDDIFKEKSKKLDKIVKDIYAQLDDIKAMYHLNEKDLEIIDQLNLKLAVIVKDHKKLHRALKKREDSYKKHNITINELMSRLNNISNEFDDALRTLGSFYEDEKRAHVELKDMNELLKKCKMKVRSYKLPIIHDNFFIEMDEAVEAISEVEKEINNKPIIIKDLNMRVETARDLTLKLYSTTNHMIKYAYFSEILIVYGNKYRENKDVNRGLSKAELLYYKGNYQECFTLLLKVIKIIDSELVNKINKMLKS